MGIFTKTKKTGNQKLDEIKKDTLLQLESIKEEKKVVRLNKQTDRSSYLKENCELIIESKKQIEDAKKEYQAVTSYLTDMQRIDLIPMEEREELEDATQELFL